MIKNKLLKLIGIPLIVGSLYNGFAPSVLNISREIKLKNIPNKPEIVEYIQPAEETLRYLNRTISNINETSDGYGEFAIISRNPNEKEINSGKHSLEKAIETIKFPDKIKEEKVINELNTIKNYLFNVNKNWDYEIELINKQKSEIIEYFNNQLPGGINIIEPTNDGYYLFCASMGFLGLVFVSIDCSKKDQ